MIIEVKGSRSPAPEAPAAAQGYAFTREQRKSKTPYGVAIALVGLFAYLKSILTGSAREDDSAYRPAGEGDPADVADAAALPPGPDEEMTTAAIDGEPEAQGSGRPLLQSYTPARFLPVDAPEMGAFMQPEIPLIWSGLPPVPLALIAENDNAGAPGVRPGPEGPDGGTPSGPGPQDGPDDPSPPDGDDPPCAGQPAAPCGDDDDEDGPQTGNRAPRVSGPVYLMDVASCAILLIGLLDLLRNAEDPDGDVLSVAGISVSSGTIEQTDGGWLYSSAPQFAGEVTISYRISDGEFAVLQTARFAVLPRGSIAGGAGDDNLLGSMCADDIDGGDGDDNIDARAGDDVVHGGAGNDHIVAGDGDDLIHAGPGDDIVFGGDGNDVIYGGAGDDRLFGDAGDDILYGEDGDDLLSGGDGSDLLFGGDGDDVLLGGDGNDRLFGGDGDDVLHDGDGEDVVVGGAGDDHVVVALDGDDDTFVGGDGDDTLDYSAATQDLTIDLVNSVATGAEIGTDTIDGFETVLGGTGNDHFILGHAPATLSGGGGENTFEFTEPAASEPSAEPVRFEITDFRAGDRVRMSKYDLFEKVFDKFEDEFERIYGDDVDDDDVRIRYRHEKDDERERTVIEADFNRDDIYETTIALEGRHLLVIIEHA